jgi:DNA-binding CsgD family transcriptional regulator/tetratricopeptide (TPR) repeat protein
VTLVGRATELARLEAAVDACRRGERSTVFVGGEAGIGKTRLVSELVARSRGHGVEILVGGCLDLEAGGVPFGPVLEALTDLFARQPPQRAELLREAGADHLDVGATAGSRGSTGTDRGRSRAGAPIDDWSAGPAEGPAPTLQAVQQVLARLAQITPVVLVVEDAHWADRSTRDLITYLASAGAPWPLALIVTYRSDDLVAGHPLRAFVAELERRPGVSHLRLERFGRADSAELLRIVLGEAAAPALTEAIFDRSEGNPFYIEELARASNADPRLLPSVLGEVLAARLHRLSEPTQRALRAAAVGGRRLDHDRLVAVAGVDAIALDGALREALAANVLVPSGADGGYRFRHALLHEAVYGSVLPGERRAFHSAYARHLASERGEEGELGLDGWTELARHWRGAGRPEEALAATIAAALSADAAYALPEAHRLYEAAIELWPPGPPSVPLPLTRTELLSRAADAASRAGAFARGVDLVSLAIEETDAATDPSSAGVLHERRGWFLWRAGEEERALAEYRVAVALVPPDPPSAARARVLAAYADALERNSEPAAARRHAEAAVEMAREVVAPLEEGHARHVLGLALGAEGETEAAIAELHRARVLAERNGDVADVAGTYVHLWRVLVEHGRSQEMIELATDAASFCRAAELEVAAALLECLAAGFLHQLGRWDEADALLAHGPDLWGLPGVVTRVVQGLVDVDRGRFGAAREHLEIARGLSIQIHDGRINGLLYRGLAELALWEGRPEDALDEVRKGLELTGDDEMRARLCALGVRAVADLAGPDPPAPAARAAAVRTLDRLVDDLERVEVRAVARQAPPGSEARAAVATARAERSRLESRSDPERWSDAAALWTELGFAAPAAYARWRAAAAILAQGRRAEAAGRWPALHRESARLGYEPLRRAIETDARRASLPLVFEDGPVPAAAPYGLTARELEVLALVAGGRTNREIGAALFISEKTASVHVSRILAKLGARTRAQAAAMAVTLGLGGGGPAQE